MFYSRHQTMISLVFWVIGISRIGIVHEPCFERNVNEAASQSHVVEIQFQFIVRHKKHGPRYVRYVYVVREQAPVRDPVFARMCF